MPEDADERPVTVDAGPLLRFATELLTAAGSDPGEAALVADNLVDADLQGIGTHGVSRLPNYIQRMRAGGVVTPARIRVVRESAATVLLDGGYGWGQVVARHAMDQAVSRARVTGLGFAGVRNSNHFGTAGFWARLAAREGMIGFACTNAAPTLAPFGARTASLGTNPVAYAFPVAGAETLVLDMATSALARAKILHAARRGEPIPAGAALDADGWPTTDAAAALEGVLLPFGGAKGSGLALVVDILAGVLTGGAFGTHVRNVHKRPGPYGVGHAFAALDVGALLDPTEFSARMIDRMNQVRRSAPAPGFDRVYAPGEMERETASRARREGIRLPRYVAADLVQCATEHGVAVPFGV